MNSNQTIGRSHSRKHYHQQSMDDFMKNIKKFNLRSQRYISPKPLLYMYAKNNTTNTIQKSRSRTLSNHKSQHSKSKRDRKDKQKNKSSTKSLKVKQKLQKIFSPAQQPLSNPRNPATIIEQCGTKLKKAQKYLQDKSSIGSYLCEQFLRILNDIVEKMVSSLDKQLKQIQQKTEKQMQKKYILQIQKMKNKMKKVDVFVAKEMQKLENCSKLVYGLRLSGIDLDEVFGRVVMGVDGCGGHGYSKNQQSHNSSYNYMPQTNQHMDHQPERMGHQVINQFLQHDAKQYKKRVNHHDQEYEDEQFSEQGRQKQKESGRIRQAYDWQREAYDDGQRRKFQLRIQNKQQILLRQGEVRQKKQEKQVRQLVRSGNRLDEKQKMMRKLGLANLELEKGREREKRLMTELEQQNEEYDQRYEFTKGRKSG